MNGEEEQADKREGFVAEERAHRLGKLDQLRERGIDPYPPRYDSPTTERA